MFMHQELWTWRYQPVLNSDGAPPSAPIQEVVVIVVYSQ